MKNLFIKGFAILWISTLLACSKEEVAPYFRSDPTKLTFDRKGSKKMFTVKTNETWSVDLNGMDWLTVDKQSGGGDDAKSQVITITASRNLKAARGGELLIKTGSQQSKIQIEQQSGLIAFGNVTFSKPLLPGDAVEGTQMVVPFSNAEVVGLVEVITSISGPGSPGLTVATVNVDLSADKGQFVIPLSGIPTIGGEVIFTIKLLGTTLEVRGNVIANNDPSGTVYLKQTFDLLVLGGDNVGNKPGTYITNWATLEGKQVLPATPAYAAAIAIRDGSANYFGNMHPSFVEARGLAGWSGNLVFEHPGYVKINTGALSDGYLATPALTKIVGRTDVKLKFTAARWYESPTVSDLNAGVIIRVLNAGTSVDANKTIALSPTWGNHEIIVTGATQATVIELRGTGLTPSRYMLDNIEISKL